MSRLIAIASLLVGLPLLAPIPGLAQEAGEGFGFEDEISLPCTPAKNQARTGTCWSFSTVSFLESELLRTGKGEHDLSEMFAVRCTYSKKAERYVANKGESAFGPGGLSVDVVTALREVGVVPEAVFDGLHEGQKSHDHGELHTVLRSMIEKLAERRRGPSPVWIDALHGVMDAYLDPYPAEFEYGGRRYTPRSFADELGLDPDRYVTFTSYNHLPFDEEVVLEIPDNWAKRSFWNVPLDDLVEIMDHSLAQGYTMVWDGDVSERSFQHRKGVANLPEKDWKDRSDDERKRIGELLEPELEVTPELRQQHFESHQTTDDHLMHVVGTANDRNGARYFRIKNSYGPGNKYDGFLYMSDAYVRSKTVTLLVHEDAVPRKISKRIGLK